MPGQEELELPVQEVRDQAEPLPRLPGIARSQRVEPARQELELMGLELMGLELMELGLLEPKQVAALMAG